MAKENSDGEVLFKKTAVGLAQQQQRLAALFGSSTSAGAESHDETSVAQNDDAYLKGGDGDDEQFGVGAIVPKEVKDGSFTNRVPSSMDKLLENLVGKKAAKAHLASKQKASVATKPQKPVKPTPPVEESDEEEGRASAFKSKRPRRTNPAPTRHEESNDEYEEESFRGSALTSKKLKTSTERTNDEPNDEEAKDVKNSIPISRPKNIRPKSYLDEILGEKSRKKKQKNGKPGQKS